MNDPVLDDLGEPAPVIPPAGHPRLRRAVVLAEDILIGAVLGAVLAMAAVVVSWWLA
ncbi:MAG: hypothetical protein AB7G65_19890 [Thermoleophilia bacterium]